MCSSIADYIFLYFVIEGIFLFFIYFFYSFISFFVIEGILLTVIAWKQQSLCKSGENFLLKSHLTCGADIFGSKFQFVMNTLQYFENFLNF